MKKITAIIQSSWKSATLEYKSLIRLANGKTVMETIVESLKKMDIVGDIILATSNSLKDRLLIREAKRLGAGFYAGETDNVLGRLRGACRSLSGPILKVDGNRPLFDHIEAEKLAHEHMLKGHYEYSYNGHYNGVIYGTDCEVFNSDIFSKIDIKRLSLSQQESGTIFIRANSRDFNIYAKRFDTPRPDYKLLLENERDVEIINSVLKNVDMISNEAIIPFFDANPIIAAHNKIEKHKEVGLNKIILFPEKLRAIHGIDVDKPDPTYPVSVEMSFTNRCNFNCIWCSDKKLRRRQADDMPLSTIKRLAKDLASHGTRGVTIEGGGEPTIVPYFEKAVTAFREAGLNVGLITNGSYKFPEATMDLFDWIRVSLDSSCSEEMKKLKGHGDYEGIMSNVIYYAKHKPVVGIGYVATNRNLSQIESLILRIRETGVSYIQFRPVIDHPEMKPDYDFEYLKKYQTYLFSVITDGMRENIVKGNGGIECRCHSLSSVVTADGSVFLCGRLNVYAWIKPLGNVNKRSFYEIWHGKERKRQANMVLNKDFCRRRCPACRITKFNMEFDKVNNIKTKNFI